MGNRFNGLDKMPAGSPQKVNGASSRVDGTQGEYLAGPKAHIEQFAYTVNLFARRNA